MTHPKTLGEKMQTAPARKLEPVGRSINLAWKMSGKVNAGTARSVLEDLANLPEPRPSLISALRQFRQRVRALARRFPQVFAELHALSGNDPAGQDDLFLMAVIGLSMHVRTVWKASRNPREAEWIIFELRQLYQRLAQKALAVSETAEYERAVSLEPQAFQDARSRTVRKAERYIFWGWWPNKVPPLAAFEQVMYRFQQLLPQARLCANSECENPYFFANSRRKFCSEICAQTGQRTYKLKWWNEEGKKRREQEQRLKKKSRRRRT
jgi:hypothetical protein